MLKIAHVGRPLAGVGVYIDLLVKHLNSADFTCILLANLEEKIIHPKSVDGIKIPSFHVPIRREIHFLNDVSAFRQLIRILKKEQPDLIHCHSAKAGILGRLAGSYLGIPTLYTPHAYSYLSAQSALKRWLFKGIEKVIGRTQAVTLTCSPSEFDRAVKDIGISPDKVMLWTNSAEDIDVSGSIPLELPNQFFCTIGRPSYQKHTELMILAMAEVVKSLPEAHLLILGVGLYSPALSSVESLIKSHKLANNITLIPWLDRPISLAVLSKSLFCVSTSRYEGMPYSLLEAIALSKPCIVTDVDGNRDVIEHGQSGYLISENASELAKRIQLLYSDPKTLREMSSAARKRFKNNFDIHTNIDQLTYIYSKMCR